MMPSIVRSGLDLIQFSIDGNSGVMNDEIRVRSSCERILRNVRLLAEVNRAAGMPMKICLTTVQFKAREQLSSDGEVLVPPWLRDAVRYYPEIYFVPAWAMQWPAWQPDSRFEVAVVPHCPPRNCSLLDETLTIRANGQAVACCYDLLSKSNLGNILYQDLLEIWDDAHAAFASRFANGDFLSPCDTCSVVTGPRNLLL